MPLVAVATGVTTMMLSHSMRIESVFPLSNLQYLLITVLIFFVYVWPRWIVDVIPVLWHMCLLLVLLSLLPSAPLPLLTSIKVIDIWVIGVCCPVGKCCFCWRSSCRGGRVRTSFTDTSYWKWWMGALAGSLGFGLLRSDVWPFGRLKSEGSCSKRRIATKR